ncbi:Hypothetical predicted protein, partial [Pelobates cultripes]
VGTAALTHLAPRGIRMAYAPSPLVVHSQNCRGLNIPERGSHLLRSLKQQHVSVAMLQETHLRPETNKLLKDKTYPTNYYSNHPTARKAGTAILLASHLQFKPIDTLSDAGGRFLFVKGEIAQKVYTFATVYTPNSGQ